MTDRFGVVFPAANNRGGVERVALQVLRHFSGSRETEFIGEQMARDRLDSVRFRQVSKPLSPSSLRPVYFRRVATRALREDRPDTLLSLGANCPPGDVYWVQSVHRSWLQTPSTVTVNGIRVPSVARRLLLRHQVLLKLEKDYFTRHQPRRILCTSQREVDDLELLYGVSRSTMHVVPVGFDKTRFNVSLRERLRNQLRKALGIGTAEISLLFVVNELHRKGFGVLLEAVARVDDPRLRIDIVGRTSPEPYRAQIERLCLSSRVHWHGSTDQVERFYAAADLLVLPTQYEPFGLVIVEALATGLPVITTALAGAAPAVVPGTGLLQQDPFDADELASLIAAALEPGIIERWGAAAPGAARPYEWSEILRKAEPLIFAD